MSQLHATVAGRYRITTRDVASGARRVVADWFDNLIVDNGLDLLATHTDYLHWCALGDSTTPADPSDTAMSSAVTVALDPEIPVQRIIDEAGGFTAATLSYVFAPGTVTTASEVGICPGGIGIGVGNGPEIDNLFSRALLPTPISPGPEQEVTVEYELRVYWPPSGNVQNVGGYAITVAPMEMRYYDNQDNLRSSWLAWDANPYARRFSYRYSDQAVRLVEPDADYAGSGAGPNTQVLSSDWVTQPAYAPGSFTRTWDFDVPPAEAVFTQQRFDRLEFTVGPAAFLATFDPPVTKGPHHRLQFQLQLSWARAVIPEETPDA